PTGPPLPPPGRRVALARDAAFSFIYPHVEAGWCAAGTVLVPFSPLADEAPPEDCDACWLPGGYPELHAPQLAAARRFLSGLRRFAATRSVHGECGGYMVLGEALVDAEGAAHPMAGLLPVTTSFAKRKMSLGYRLVTTDAPSALGPAGAVLSGHEFHYATIAEAASDGALGTARDAEGSVLGPVGHVRGHVSGSFFHAIARLPG
ncbi:MAG: cobyrinate a,c-diamide synthase, partial [Phreatobacter sp.]